jgi:hypothetical protein
MYICIYVCTYAYIEASAREGRPMDSARLEVLSYRDENRGKASPRPKTTLGLSTVLYDKRLSGGSLEYLGQTGGIYM